MTGEPRDEQTSPANMNDPVVQPAPDETASAHDAAHGHSPHLAHHYATESQQFASGKLGMWVFLATEILMFGGLFCGYAVYRANHPQMFINAHHLLDTTLGAINTVILIASSFTMAWAVRATQLSRRTLAIALLACTLVGGVGFMVIKYVEYEHKFHIGTGPGRWFNEQTIREHFPAHEAEEQTHGTRDVESAAGPDRRPGTGLAAAYRLPEGAEPGDEVPEEAEPAEHAAHAPVTAGRVLNARPFFNIYFAMTGLHGIHVLVGMGLIAWILVRSVRGQFSAAYFAPVDLVGLYWHVVDLIWIFLFPLLYLIH